MKSKNVFICLRGTSICFHKPKLWHEMQNERKDKNKVTTRNEINLWKLSAIIGWDLVSVFVCM